MVKAEKEGRMSVRDEGYSDNETGTLDSEPLGVLPKISAHARLFSTVKDVHQASLNSGSTGGTDTDRPGN